MACEVSSTFAGAPHWGQLMAFTSAENFSFSEETLGELWLELVRQGPVAATPGGGARDRPPPEHDDGDDDEHEQEQDGRRGADGRRQKQDEDGEQHGAVTEWGRRSRIELGLTYIGMEVNTHKRER